MSHVQERALQWEDGRFSKGNTGRYGCSLLECAWVVGGNLGAWVGCQERHDKGERKGKSFQTTA